MSAFIGLRFAAAAPRVANVPNAAMNNLKIIGLAMHNYHDTNQRFPAAAIYDKQGKPLLSWRVAILPYLNQKQLYESFHLDEPWDSEHNRKLIPRMPAEYAAAGAMPPPGAKPAPALGKTRYVLPTGKIALFQNEKG